MKRMLVALSALALVAFVSCKKEETPVGRTEGRPVTITVGLAPETRISHEYGTLDNGKTGVKTAWGENDFVFVEYGETREVFQIETGVGEKTATFYKEDSALPENTAYTVIYASPRYMKPRDDGTYSYRSFSVRGQTGTGIERPDGTLENLPEYLVGEVAAGGDRAVLESQLVYFHIIIKHTDQTVSYPYNGTLYIETGSPSNAPSLPDVSVVQGGVTLGAFRGQLYYNGSVTNNLTPNFVKPDPSLVTLYPNTSKIKQLEFYYAGFMPTDPSTLTNRFSVRPYINNSAYQPVRNGQKISWPFLVWTRSKEYVPGRIYTKTLEF